MKRAFYISLLICCLAGCATRHQMPTVSHTDQRRSYNDCINRADQCFMQGDYKGASEAFAEAFMCHKDEITGQHLYNAACAAALAGQPDVAFERLNMRLEKEPGWYVDDPNRDNDLVGLHGDSRWQAY